MNQTENTNLTVKMHDTIVHLLIACNFNLDEVNKYIDSFEFDSNTSKLLKKIARDMKWVAIKKGLIEE